VYDRFEVWYLGHGMLWVSMQTQKYEKGCVQPVYTHASGASPFSFIGEICFQYDAGFAVCYISPVTRLFRCNQSSGKLQNKFVVYKNLTRLGLLHGESMI
jgi:hypothetical protein